MAQANSKEKEPRFTRDELIRSARSLDSRPAEVAGALAGQKRKRFSHAETRKLIGKFRNRKVEMS